MTDLEKKPLLYSIILLGLPIIWTHRQVELKVCKSFKFKADLFIYCPQGTYSVNSSVV